MLLALLTASAGQLVGKWAGETFTVTRKINYANTYLPFAKGRIAPSGSGSVIDLTYSAPYSVLVIFVFALGGYFVVTRGRSEDVAIWMGIGILTHVACVLLFFWEKYKIERKLREILECEMKGD